jgi:hypothetical protein
MTGYGKLAGRDRKDHRNWVDMERYLSISQGRGDYTIEMAFMGQISVA